MSKAGDLLALCETFIKTNNIYCPEKIYQSDQVIESAYEFIEQICNIAGYIEPEQDNE
jgi:hypothetical protein